MLLENSLGLRVVGIMKSSRVPTSRALFVANLLLGVHASRCPNLFLTSLEYLPRIGKEALLGGRV